jgi:hypothetical protein
VWGAFQTSFLPLGVKTEHGSATFSAISKLPVVMTSFVSVLCFLCCMLYHWLITADAFPFLEIFSGETKILLFVFFSFAEFDHLQTHIKLWPSLDINQRHPTTFFDIFLMT